VKYYNGARPSQALHAIPDPYPELRKVPPATGMVIALPVLGGVQHDYRRVGCETQQLLLGDTPNSDKEARGWTISSPIGAATAR